MFRIQAKQFKLLVITLTLIIIFSACATKSDTIESNTTENEAIDRQQYLYDNMNTIEMIDFTLPDFDGIEHNLSDYKGKIIVLNFWAIGCPPCVNELPDFNEVCTQEGVQLITVAQKNILGNVKDKSGEYIKQFDAINLWDETGNTMQLYPSQYYPHSYIIDRQGIVRFVINSASYELLDELVTFCDDFLD